MRIEWRTPSSALLLLAVLLLIHCGSRESGSEPVATTGEVTGEDHPGPFDMARELTSQKRHGEAALEYERLAEEFSHSGDEHNLWKATLEKARSVFRTPQKAEAIKIVRQAGELANGDVEREIETAYLHTVFLHETGRLVEALEMGRKTARWAARSTDPDLVWKGAVSATVFSLMGRYRESLIINEDMVVRFRHELPHPLSLAQQLNEVGIDYRHLGRYDEARRVYEEALEFFRENGPDRWLRIVLANLSNVYTDIGDLDRSLALKFESLELLEEMDAPYYLALTLHGIGIVHGRAGNLNEAREYLERAIKVSREAKRPYPLVAGLIGLAGVELENKRAARALDLAIESISIADESEYGFESADARAIAARAEVALRNPAEALRWAEEAVERAGALEDPSLLLQARQARAGALSALGRREDAAVEYERSIVDLETWRGRLAMGDLRMGLTEPRISLYEDAITNLFELGRLEQAFEVAERARARLLLELIAVGREGIPCDDPCEELIDHLREKYAASVDASSARIREASNREVDALIEEIEALEERLRRSDPTTAAARHPRSISVAEATRSLIAPTRALLTFFWGDEHVYGWWVGTGGIRGARLGSTEELRPITDFLRSALEQPDTNIEWRAAARRAYRLFVAPLDPDNVDELLIVPDGPLSLIPLEILLEGDTPWGIQKRIIYGPSASVLAALARNRENRHFKRTMLALGAPTLDARSTDRALRQGVALDPLRYAAEEARYIAELFPSTESELLVGSDATLEKWLDSDPGDARYLHFATHAVVSDRRPEQTHLVLTGGILDLATIHRQTLHADLVTVSACESAIGKRVRGEGTIGLPHAFLAAGARGTVVAQWNVEDRAAADFMRHFYREMRRGMSTAEALRIVRRSWFENDGERSHPARWATFIQIGGLRSASE